MVPRTSQRRALRTQLPPQANDHCWSPTLLPSPHAKGPLVFPQQEVPSLGLQEGNLGGDPGPCACPTASPDPSAPHTRRPHGREVPCLRGTAPPSSNAPRVCSALPPFSLTPTPRPWARPAPGSGAPTLPACPSLAPGSARIVLVQLCAPARPASQGQLLEMGLSERRPLSPPEDLPPGVVPGALSSRHVPG